MKKTLKLTAPWTDPTDTEKKEHEIGTVLKLDEKTAQTLIDAGIAKEFDEEREEAAEKAMAEMTKQFGEKAGVVLAEALKQHAKENGHIMRIEMVSGGDQIDKELEGYTFADQLMDVKNSMVNKSGFEGYKHLEATHKKSANALGLNEQIDSEGGFLVDVDTMQELHMRINEVSILTGLTQQQPIGANSNAFVWKALKDSNRTNGNRGGGLIVSRTHEAATVSRSKMKFERRELRLEKLVGIIFATEEQLQDTVQLAGMVDREFGKEFAFVSDNEVYRGSGAGEMLGMLNSPALVTVAKFGGQAADTILKVNLDNMWSRMHPSSMMRARWYINQDTWPELLNLNAGVDETPVFLPAGMVADAPFGTIYGRPIIPLEHCSTLGDLGDIMFADLGQYLTIDKGGIKAASSIHVRFEEGETAFRFTMRSNGQPMWEEPLTPPNSTATQSPFIALAERT